VKRGVDCEVKILVARLAFLGWRRIESVDGLLALASSLELEDIGI